MLSQTSFTFCVVFVLVVQKAQTAAAQTKEPWSSNVSHPSDVVSEDLDKLDNDTDDSQEFDNSENSNNGNDVEITQNIPQYDPSSLPAWRDREEMGRQVRTHIPQNYPTDRSGMFPRMSRGRLDRMPLTFGKRNSFLIYDHPFGSQDEFTRYRKGRMDRMPLSFGKRAEFVPGSTDKGTMQSAFVRTQKGSLDRMPLTFGKRYYLSDHSGKDSSGFVRVAKGSLARMPLSFGKRDESLGDAETLLRFARDRLNRMPITFGKRTSEGQSDDSDMDLGFSSSSNRIPKVLEKRSADEDHPRLFRMKRGSLDRMPLTFGKRVSDGEFNTMEMFPRFARGALDRMPFNFGKRAENEEADIYSGEDYMPPAFPRMSRGSLDRMPLTFGKRMPPYEEIASGHFTAFTEGNTGEMPVSSEIHSKENEAVYGGSGDGKDKDFFTRVSKGSLDRMPISFGKRTEDEISNYFDRTTRDRVGRMSLTFGKRSIPSYGRMLQELRFKIQALPPNKRNELNAQLNNMFNDYMAEQGTLDRFQRSRIGRMPLTFGKRNSANTAISPDLDVFAPKVQRRSRMSRMPFNFGKRFSYFAKRQRVSRMPMGFGKPDSPEDKDFEDLIPYNRDASWETVPEVHHLAERSTVSESSLAKNLIDEGSNAKQYRPSFTR